MIRFTLLLCLTGLVASGAVSAQSTSASTLSGKIQYDGLRRIDMSQVRMVINGQEVRPGSVDTPDGMPEVVSFTQKLLFAGSFAKEERDRPQNMAFRRTRDANGTSAPVPDGQAGAPDRPQRRFMRPNEQETYIDLANRQRISIMTSRRDSTQQRYRTDQPFPQPVDWQLSDKTKKIAGYVCHKATTTRKKLPYTIWYTTDLPFTYSPIADLTPTAGVVLQIESDDESYKASAVSLEPVDGASLQPPADAKRISMEEMDQLRKKQMADFRQRMMQNGGFPGRN